MIYLNTINSNTRRLAEAVDFKNNYQDLTRDFLHQMARDSGVTIPVNPGCPGQGSRSFLCRLKMHMTRSPEWTYPLTVLPLETRQFC